MKRPSVEEGLEARVVVEGRPASSQGEPLMTRSVRRAALSTAILAGCGLLGWSGGLRAAETADIGTILAVQGEPTVRDPAGHASRSVALQPIHVDDEFSLKSGDRLTLCNEQLGAVFEIEGPGSVRLTRTFLTRTVGSPRVKSSGSCDTGAPGDTNGGVVLRTIEPGPAH